jgi:hypothetical protein
MASCFRGSEGAAEGFLAGHMEGRAMEGDEGVLNVVVPDRQRC